MTKVLAVWPYPPWPSATGTQRRLARLTEELRRHAEVAVVVTAPGELVDPAVPVLAHVEAPRRLPHLVHGFAHAATHGEPLFTGFFHRPDAVDAVRRQVERWAPDVVWAHGLAGDTVVRGVVAADRTVLDLSDAEHQRFLRLAETASRARGALWRLDARRVRSWAAARLPQLRTVSVVSAGDRDAYAALAPGARFVEVPNGVDASPAPRPDPGGGRLVFLGDLRYPPNAQALQWFVAHVLPDAAKVEALVAVGRGDAPAHPRVEQTGFVADLDEVWRRCVAMVVPITTGGGTRLKVLDAMGAGVPIVSTAFGVDGIGAVAGEHYVRAETAAEFAAACDLIVGDRQLRDRVAAAAHELVRERFSWERCLDPLLPALDVES